VTVTLRNLFKGEALTPAASSRLAELGRIAAAHPTFPVVVVLHQDKEPAKKGKDQRDERAQMSRAELVVKALKAERAPRVELVLAGAALPVVNPEGADRARNARVEVVFVTPETF
jgi:flagellar motor protein MotB